MEQQMISLKELNKMSCTRVNLQMLRCFGTSDLTSHYMLYKEETIKDIVNEVTNMFKTESESGELDLSPEEITEFNGYVMDMNIYAGDC